MKVRVQNYTFNHTTHAITFSDYAAINLDCVLGVFDVTAGVMLYSVSDSTKGGSVATNVLTLTFDTSGGSYANTDKLLIYYDDPLFMFPGLAGGALSAWNSATALNATQNIFSGLAAGGAGAMSVIVQLTQTTTLTAGAITFEWTFDGINWLTVPANCIIDPTSTTMAQIAVPYTVQASTNKQFTILLSGAQGLRIKLSTAITGSGTVTPNYILVPYDVLEAINILQLGGNAIKTNSGNGSAGSLNVYLATDQPQLTNALLVAISGRTTGGASTGIVISAASTNATSVKGSAGTLKMLAASNINSSPRYLKIYDKASAPAVGTDVPKFVFLLPGNSSGAGSNIPLPPEGIAFANGIALALTTGVANSDTGAVAANEQVVNIAYL